MNRYYPMSVSRLRDELDRLEEQLYDLQLEGEDENEFAIRRLEDLINNVCNLIFRKERAA